jgi:hypothetical protein
LPLSFRIPHSTFRIMRNWFNQADATYRGDLRELNELNFARFDAKLEQRLTQLDAKLEQRLAELRADLRDELHAQGKMLMRWMVGLWMTAIGLLSGILVAAVHFLPILPAARP